MREYKRNETEIMDMWARNEQGDGEGRGEKCDECGEASKKEEVRVGRREQKSKTKHFP